MDTRRKMHDAVNVQRLRQRSRWLVVIGFVIWSAGLGVWTMSWIIGLTTLFVGGVILTRGLEILARGSNPSKSTNMRITLPVAISLILISQGVGTSSFGTRVTFVALGTLVMILVFVHILDERLAIERALLEHTVSAERHHLASEVHDVVGHTLTASMLHISAARLSTRTDPAATISSLERAEHHMRRSINDIRSVVRLLRDDPGTARPAPLMEELSDLVHNFCIAGANISLTMEGKERDIPTVCALTAYRVVQEGLTNAVRHGSGKIDVSTQWENSGIRIKIINSYALNRASTRTGSGLVGIRERVELIGGIVEVGDVNGDGTWVLQVWIPT